MEAPRLMRCPPGRGITAKPSHTGATGAPASTMEPFGIQSSSHAARRGASTPKKPRVGIPTRGIELVSGSVRAIALLRKAGP